MTKFATQKNWSRGRKRRVFKSRTAKSARDIIERAELSKLFPDLNRDEIKALSKIISKRMLRQYQSTDFMKLATKFDRDAKLKETADVEKIFQNVKKSSNINELID